MLTSRVTAMRISRKEREKFKMAINFDYDFSGWATKANVKCFDGLTIAPNAFKDCDGKVVPVVWNHDHSAPESVLGHALLQNRKEGVYALRAFWKLLKISALPLKTQSGVWQNFLTS